MSIARALAGQPRLLVLDEPTSALDSRSEGLVRATLASLRGDVTVVVIAHRMSTLEICDRILTIDGGRIAGLDPPEVVRTRHDEIERTLRSG
jgi:ABC-type multidrug transport system fused ATPase/permease subunit